MRLLKGLLWPGDMRRMLESGLTPGFNPDGGAPIPEPNVRRPIAGAAAPIPEARIPEFNPRPMSRSDEFYGARDEALGRKEPRWRTVLQAGLRSMQGSNNLGDALGR